MKDNLLKPLATFFILLICAISLARVSMPPTQERANLPQKQSAATKTAASYRPYKVNQVKAYRIPKLNVLKMI